MITGIREFFAPSEETVERYAMIHFSHLLGLPESTLHEAGIYETTEGGYYDPQVSQYVSAWQSSPHWLGAYRRAGCEGFESVIVATMSEILTHWVPERIPRPWE
jgi:hypothetical protein